MILKANNLSFEYHNKKILDNVNLQIEAGKIYAIAGPNGAGKTTLLRCLAGTLETPKNTILLHNKDLRSYKPKNYGRKTILTDPLNTFC